MIVELLAGVSDETITRKDGSPMRLRAQRAQLYAPDWRTHGVVGFKVRLSDTDPPYAPGFYAFSVDSFQTERNSIGFAYSQKLVPAPGAAVSALGIPSGKGAA